MLMTVEVAAFFGVGVTTLALVVGTLGSECTLIKIKCTDVG